MKRFLLTLVGLVLMTTLGLAAYLATSPYHVRLRADIVDPAKRQAAALGALSFEKMHVKALAGRPDEEYALARHFTTGDLGFKDADQAEHWYQRAADHGYPRAELRMAAYCFAGDGVPKDEITAADWTQKASQAGLPEASDLMGILLAGGIGGPQDLTASMDMLKKAHSSKALLIAMDTDQKLKIIYALPREQRDGELKKLSDSVKATVQTQFPDILSETVSRGVVDVPEQVAAK